MPTTPVEPVHDPFVDGDDQRCPRPSYVVGTACAPTLVDAERQALSSIIEQLSSKVTTRAISVHSEGILANGTVARQNYYQAGVREVASYSEVDIGGLAEVVTARATTRGVCALRCLQRARLEERRTSAESKDATAIEPAVREIRERLSRRELVAAVEKLEQLRERLADHEDAETKPASDLTPVRREAAKKALIELENEMRTTRSRVLASVAVSVRLLSEDTDPRIVDLIKTGLVDATLRAFDRRGLRTRGRGGYLLMLEASVSLDNPEIDTPPIEVGIRMTLLAPGRIRVRSKTVDPTTTRADGASLHQATTTSLRHAEEELDHAIGDWFGDE
jgi:hypothetical protein